MAEKADRAPSNRGLVVRTVLAQNRDFFDQFFTRVVRTRFQVASDESSIRRMNIIAGSCTTARCQLSANSHTLVLMASQMASTGPEIHVAYTPPEGSRRPHLQTVLRYQPPSGWVDPESARTVGDLTTWIDLTISSFLEWSAAALA